MYFLKKYLMLFKIILQYVDKIKKKTSFKIGMH